jgi:hypothetical protein
MRESGDDNLGLGKGDLRRLMAEWRARPHHGAIAESLWRLRVPQYALAQREPLDLERSMIRRGGCVTPPTACRNHRVRLSGRQRMFSTKYMWTDGVCRVRTAVGQ